MPRGGQPGFAELPPSQTGIRFTNAVTLDSALWNRHLAQGGGVALGDVDGDGLPDVYLTSNEGSNVLYRNLGGWRFEDITAQAGVALTGRHSTGVAGRAAQLVLTYCADASGPVRRRSAARRRNAALARTPVGVTHT